MLFERFEVEGLSHYSYAVGCEGAGLLAIVDPERNVDRYLAFAAARKMRIAHVLETHIHADYASGARALAEATGAALAVSKYDEGETYEVTFPHVDLADGDAIGMGKVRITVKHTPGHTPEHVSFLVYDGARTTATPMLMLSGDFLFVGSVGRPDLLGEEAKRELARKLYRSTRDVLATLPDGIEIHPAHGAGSMCGAGMSGRPCSTLGYERLANPYLDADLTEEDFVTRILATLPPFPPYYRRMKQVNGDGPAAVDPRCGRTALTPERFRDLADRGHVVIDLRHQVAFDGAHIPGSFGIGIAPAFVTWAAWVVPYDTPILLVAEDPGDVERATRALVRVGLDAVAGHLDGGIEAWRAAGLPLRQTALLQPSAVHERILAGTVQVVDVRSDAEWKTGHAPGALHIMGGTLAERLDEIPDRTAPIAVVCGGGYRSVVAASVLERAGYESVIDVIGGMAAWTAAGLPLVRDEPAACTADRGN